MALATINGIRIAYEASGDGEPILCVGGGGMPAQLWELSGAPAFRAGGYHVVTFDSRGVGSSDAPPPPYSIADMATDTAALIEDLDLAPCRLVGVSLGGFVAETLAWSRPELVRAFVLVASGGRTTSFARARVEAEHDLLEVVPDPPRSYNVSRVLSLLPTQLLQDDDHTVESWIALLSGMSDLDQNGRLGQFAAMRDWFRDPNRTTHWDKIAAPALIIAFEHDLLLPPSRGREMAAALRNANFIEIPGVGHTDGPFNAADAVSAAALDFFART